LVRVKGKAVGGGSDMWRTENHLPRIIWHNQKIEKEKSRSLTYNVSSHEPTSFKFLRFVFLSVQISILTTWTWRKVLPWAGHGGLLFVSCKSERSSSLMKSDLLPLVSTFQGHTSLPSLLYYR
jgi:hypothetical protein